MSRIGVHFSFLLAAGMVIGGAPAARAQSSGHDQSAPSPRQELQHAITSDADKSMIERGIDHVQAMAETADPEYGEVARGMEFVDVHFMGDEQEKHIIDEIRKANPKLKKLKEITDQKILDQCVHDVHDGNVEKLNKANIVIYNSRSLTGASQNYVEAVFAHEIGHQILRKGGETDEHGADRIAAQIVGPQAFIDGIAEAARRDPKTNDIKEQKGGRDYHGTDYERALRIQKDFPDAHVNLANFPKPTRDAFKQKKNAAPLGVSSVPPPGF